METDKVEIGPLQPTQAGQRRRFSVRQKQAFAEESMLVGSSVSIVARKYGLALSLLFKWRYLMQNGGLASLEADEELVPASQLKELKARNRELERLLGKKTVELEIMREALDIVHEKKRMWRLPSLNKGDFK